MEPIATGIAGKAYEINLQPETAAQEAMLKQWLLNLPKQSPAWSDYSLGLCHLRDIPGARPAKKRYPDAEYELLFFALNPDYNPDPTNINSLAPLTPINYSTQFHDLTDGEAVVVATKMMQGLVDGQYFAEPQGIVGAREWWERSIEDFVEEAKAARTKS